MQLLLVDVSFPQLQSRTQPCQLHHPMPSHPSQTQVHVQYSTQVLRKLFVNISQVAVPFEAIYSRSYPKQKTKNTPPRSHAKRKFPQVFAQDKFIFYARWLFLVERNINHLSIYIRCSSVILLLFCSCVAAALHPCCVCCVPL